MKKLFATTLIFTALLTAGVVFAHTNSDSAVTNPMEQMMRQMMGDQTFEAMEEMEHQMMGEENHARIEELMNKIFAGNISSDEQKEMTQMMQDNMAGPGMMTMIMRMMMPQMMQNAGLGGPLGMMGFGGSGIYWITIILLWAVLILAIVALIKWLTKNK